LLTALHRRRLVSHGRGSGKATVVTAAGGSSGEGLIRHHSPTNLRGIDFHLLHDISRFTATIAAAVEQQTISTQEIARNVQQAAMGANELAGDMTSVTTAIDEDQPLGRRRPRGLRRAVGAGRNPAARD